METGLVSIDFIGVAAPALAEIAKIKAALIDLQRTAGAPIIPGAGGAGIASPSIETQIAPVRAASQARRQIFKDEADMQAENEAVIRGRMSASIKKDLEERKALLAIGRKDYDEYLTYVSTRIVESDAKIAAANKVMLDKTAADIAATQARVSAAVQASEFRKWEGVSVPWTPPISATQTNISEAERVGGAGFPTVLPGSMREVPRGTGTRLEEGIEGGARRSPFEIFQRHPYVANRFAREGIQGGMSLSEGVEGAASGFGNTFLSGAPFLASHPLVAAGMATAGVGMILGAETMKIGGGFEMESAKTQALTGMSGTARQAFENAARYEALHSGKTPNSDAKDFEEAARILVSRLLISKGDVDKYMPVLLQMLDVIRKYAVATQQSVPQAATDLLSKAKTTGFDVRGNAQAPEQFKQLANIFAGALQSGGLIDPAGLGAAVRKVGGVAQMAEMPTEDMLAMLQGMAVTGDSGQVIGTALRQYLRTLTGGRQTKAITGGLGQMGLDIKDISIMKQPDGSQKSMMDVIKLLDERTKKLEPENRSKLLSDLFGQRWQSFFTQMTTNMPAIENIRGQLGKQPDLDTMSKTMEGTMQFKEGTVGKQFKDLFIGVFQDDKGDFKKFVDDVGKLMKDVKAAEPEFALITTFFVKMIDAAIRMIHPLMGGQSPTEKAEALTSADIPKRGSTPSALRQQVQGPNVNEGTNLTEYLHNIDKGYEKFYEKNVGKANIKDYKAAILADMTTLEGIRDKMDKGEPIDRDLMRRAMQSLEHNIFGDVTAPLPGKREGGHTGYGPDDKAAGVVHGGEYVFDAPIVRKVGVHRLDALRNTLRGYRDGGEVMSSDTQAAIARWKESHGGTMSTSRERSFIEKLGDTIEHTKVGHAFSSFLSGLTGIGANEERQKALDQLTGVQGGNLRRLGTASSLGYGVTSIGSHALEHGISAFSEASTLAETGHSAFHGNEIYQHGFRHGGYVRGYQGGGSVLDPSAPGFPGFAGPIREDSRTGFDPMSIFSSLDLGGGASVNPFSLGMNITRDLSSRVQGSSSDPYAHIKPQKMSFLQSAGQVYTDIARAGAGVAHSLPGADLLFGMPQMLGVSPNTSQNAVSGLAPQYQHGRTSTGQSYQYGGGPGGIDMGGVSTLKDILDELKKGSQQVLPVGAYFDDVHNQAINTESNRLH